MKLGVFFERLGDSFVIHSLRKKGGSLKGCPKSELFKHMKKKESMKKSLIQVTLWLRKLKYYLSPEKFTSQPRQMKVTTGRTIRTIFFWGGGVDFDPANFSGSLKTRVVVFFVYHMALPGTLNNHFLLDVWWNNHFSCNDLESSNWNNHL